MRFIAFKKSVLLARLAMLGLRPSFCLWSSSQMALCIEYRLYRWAPYVLGMQPNEHRQTVNSLCWGPKAFLKQLFVS